MINQGDAFPGFSLQDQNGQTVSNDDLAGAKAVVYFYPKDDTSGCTAEACEFSETFPNIEGVRVVGVSPDDVKSHKKFEQKYDLKVTLLADPEKKLIGACGLWVEKSMYGKKYMGVERTTYLLDERGTVLHVWQKVKPQGHAAEVAAVLSQ